MATTPEAESAESATAARWIGWLSNFALGGAILAVLVALGGLTLARYDVIAKIDGFMAFMRMFQPAAVIALLAALALALTFWRKTKGRMKAIVALVLSLGLLLVMYTQVMLPGGSVPPIHDITTDMDDPPQFAVLDRPTTSTGPFTIEEWRAFHSEAYGDVQPIIVDKDPAQVLGDARALMEQRGWDVALVDTERGHIEGTAYAGYLRFRDDVVVEVTPVADGSSRVDMRSVSRVGVSDLGYNAARIRKFLADLQAA
ncbi:DUF1499 domain-containing protein [Alteraurantiacibacter aquimixticola]|uniref:DUF1499 domain-containing protein n=1 Tax=Alteraurantiacibacter aquimixticola TaxID=2489173 RepID=A0A4T3F2M7_9SPHN|nr:DUF1499 domain-containing protein [Alteraurantiacibacter aquimixticola]TIX50565.1 DUF1499 domain-containing protein [Alteraurantiacibacter aquimixticola]